jgi:hypothetical protein
MPIKWDRAKAEELISELYSRLFERAPERDVLRGLAGYFAEGRVSVRIQLMRMLKSEEFFDKRLRDKTPQDMAAELYRQILGRPAESEEALQGAADSVGSVGWQIEVDVMINSEEFIGRFGDDALPPRIPAIEQEVTPKPEQKRQR